MMARLFEVRKIHRGLIALVVGGGLVIYAACNSNSVPELVSGPAVIGNERPSLTITQPAANLSIAQSGTFTISWTDQDRDSAAMISFALVNINANASPASVLLVQGIPEDDTAAADSITVTTTFVPRGSYYLEGIIDDGLNAPVTTFAATLAPASTRVVITVGEEQSTPSNRPPTVFVAEPRFNLSVTLDDTIPIEVQPTASSPTADAPYDADNSTLLYLSLDLDDDPLTGDPLNPDPALIIPLLDNPISIAQGSFAAIPLPISVDPSRFPLREDGKPYYIRATITDGQNVPRDAYAKGTINVSRFVTGRVDLAHVGGTITGATWLGFNPGARLGAALAGVTNFDAGAGATTENPAGDVTDDFMLVAEFGVPTGRFPIGEAFLVYGMDHLRFGGRINVNTVATDVDGAIFEAPEPHLSQETRGIASVGYIPDLSGDGRPELLFGMPFVDGARQHRDDDPGDRAVEANAKEEFVAKIQQGNVQVYKVDAFGNLGDPIFTNLAYTGVLDTMLDLNNPTNTAPNSARTLTWSGTESPEFTATQWVVLQFNDVEDNIPGFSRADTSLEIVSATLFVDVLARGDVGEVHALYTPIASNTTLQSFSGGAAPLEKVDYNDKTVEGTSFPANFTGYNSVVVTDTLKDIVAFRQDLFGWIVVPTAARSVQVGSSEANSFSVRPRLEIRFKRAGGVGFLPLAGCYPDNLPNNASNDALGGEDDIFAGLDNYESMGVVAMVNSENRDTEFDLAGTSTQEQALTRDRLRQTTAILDLAGQQTVTEGGSVHMSPAYGAGLPDDTQRLSGARFQVCMYEVVDALSLAQGPVRADFGQRVGFLPDIDNDQRPEIILSSPRNEQDVADLLTRYPDLAPFCTDPLDFGCQITHLSSRPHWGNVIIYHGLNYAALRENEKGDDASNATWPHFNRTVTPGSCSPPVVSRQLDVGAEYNFTVLFGEKPDDLLGDGSSAGDFNLDGLPDVLCGAPFADGPGGEDVGTTYIVYMRQENQDQNIHLVDANNSAKRPPMLRIRGDQPDDRIGWAQESILDINGDRINDIVLASPYADAGGVSPRTCTRDYNGNGTVDAEDSAAFNSCRARYGTLDLSSDNTCAVFDYNNDRQIDELDAAVFVGGDCPVDNGVIAVVFGGIMLDGDRVVNQIATSDLPGVVFYGAAAGDRAGHDVASAGDFNRDGYGDLLISAPGARVLDANGQTRVGAVYLVFGGPHLANRRFSLADVGSADLSGIVFLSPFVAGAPDEAPPQYVAGIGDVNNDGFDDIAIGNPLADFVDDTYPQEPGNPGGDLGTGRRRDAGEAYLIYGNNVAENP
jgi:hypothetical protein